MAISRLSFFTITSLVCYGIAWASGIYLALIGFRGNPAECSSNCLPVLVLSGVAWLLVLTVGHYTFVLFLRSGSSTPRGAESLDIGTSREDEQIVGIVRELLSHRRVANRLRNVEKLAWSNVQRWDSTRFKWQGYRNPSVFVISSGLRGRLDVEEWRIYLGWKYLQSNPRQTIYAAQPVIRGLIPLLLAGATGAFLSFTLGQYASLLFGSIFGPAVILISLYCMGPAFKNLLLRLDAIASQSLGRMKMLSLFTKIDGLQLPENEKAKKRAGWTARLWPEPNIAERIANLQ